jgi:hypothetical protein
MLIPVFFDFTCVSLHMFKCIGAHTLYCLLLSVCVCSIFVAVSTAQYFVYNAWHCAATISFFVFTFGFFLDSQRNVPSSVIMCVLTSSVLAMQCIVFPIISVRTLSVLSLCVVLLRVLCHCSHFIDLILQQTLLLLYC